MKTEFNENAENIDGVGMIKVKDFLDLAGDGE